MIKKATFLFLLISAPGFPQVGWTLVSNVPNYIQVNSISAVDQNIVFVCCNEGKVFRSLKGGLSWQDISAGLPSSNCYSISAIDSLNCWVVSGSPNGAVYRTTDGGTNWEQQIIITGSFINNIKMFNYSYGWYFADPVGSGQSYQFRYTIDGGVHWLPATTAPSAPSEFGVIGAWDYIDTNRIWIGSANILESTTSAKIYKTTTGISGTWSFGVGDGTGTTAGLYWQALAFTDALKGMAASNNDNIIKTTDGGITWLPVAAPEGLTTFAALNMCALKDGSNTVRISTSSKDAAQIFKTTNYGTTWTEEKLPSEVLTSSIQQIQFLSAELGFAGGANGIFLKYVGIVPVELTSFTAAASPGKVSLSWKTVTETNNSGFEIERKIDDDEFALIGFKNGYGTSTVPKEYKYTDDITSINAECLTYRLRQIDFNGNPKYSPEVKVDDIVPIEYTLGQNFPNPFNPTTTIKFRIPEDGFVNLKVYNSLGQEELTLVSENKAAGTYEVQLNALKLTSGIYYYVLKVNDFLETKKMTLLK